jgi:hypothetical protein
MERFFHTGYVEHPSSIQKVDINNLNTASGEEEEDGKKKMHVL